VAQIGKAFRNEITTRSFIFRTREFEQMEMQYFVRPEEDKKWFEYWKQERFDSYLRLGVKESRLRFSAHGPEELAHYAKEAFDIQFEYPFGWEELEGIHNRTDYDLKRHSEFSGKDLTYLDDATNRRYIPYIVETAAGLTRNVLMILSDAYDEERVKDETRVVLRMHPGIAPVTVGVFPLVKKDGLAEIAKEITQSLKDDMSVYYDQGGAIGRRYRRQDEIGTPFCVTVDYQTKEDGSVTLRYRDSMEQVRVARGELMSRIQSDIKAYRRIS
jgi:glycyl-tRNA synthetase